MAEVIIILPKGRLDVLVVALLTSWFSKEHSATNCLNEDRCVCVMVAHMLPLGALVH